MPIAEEAKHLVAWPKKADDMTVDLMLRIIGAEAQGAWLRKWRDIEREKDHFKSPLYHQQTETVLGCVGFMLALRALASVNPEKALEVARDYWSMCDDGSEFGPSIWQFTKEAGLDPAMVIIDPPPPTEVPADAR